MKPIFTITCYLIFLSTAWSRSDATPMAMTAYGVASEARAEFEATGRWSPMDKLISIEQSALRAKAPGKLILFNTLAGVPGTPIISDGVNLKYSGFRLYAISRIPNFERAYTLEEKETGGRFAVLFKEQNGKVTNMEIPWIVESDAQVILQKTGGFDPRKAPFVFEDTYVKLGGKIENLYKINNFEKLEKHPDPPDGSQSKISESPEASSQQDNSKNEAALERSEKSRLLDESKSSEAIEKTTHPLLKGIIGGSIVLLVIALVGWLKSRNSKFTS